MRCLRRSRSLGGLEQSLITNSSNGRYTHTADLGMFLCWHYLAIVLLWRAEATGIICAFSRFPQCSSASLLLWPSVAHLSSYSNDSFCPQVEYVSTTTVFLRSDAAATIFFALFVIIRLLLEGDYYLRLAFISLGSRQIATTADMQTIQLGLVVAVSQSCCQPWKRDLEHEQP